MPASLIYIDAYVMHSTDSLTMLTRTKATISI